jgi:DegV family protein with EDD domain
MSFRIVGDSCCDFTEKELEKEYIRSVPLTLTVGDKEILDDENIDTEKLIKLMAECDEAPRSACPSPEAFMKNFDGVNEVYVVTLSSKLSGSYNSAMIAKQIYTAEHPEVKVHVFDSKSAAAAQHLICEKIEECALAGMTYRDVVSTVNDYIGKQKTYFVLEDLSVFIKNGRVPRVKGAMANVLNIKPVLAGDDGEIVQLDQGRGMNKALNKMLWQIEKQGFDKTRKVEITECNSYERCMNIRKIMIEKFGFKNVVVLKAHGLSTMDENEGGVVLSF